MTSVTRQNRRENAKIRALNPHTERTIFARQQQQEQQPKDNTKETNKETEKKNRLKIKPKSVTCKRDPLLRRV
jgi:hypothetical protein